MTEQQLSLLQAIMSYRFAVLEFNLYLNTHPRDKGALDQYNKFSQELREACSKYQKKYGPLTATFPSESKWEYYETDWPWQINYG